jgi:hypothetical protein
MTRLAALLLGLSLLPACGSGSDDDDDDVGPGSSGSELVCATREFKLEGELGGQSVSHQGTLNGHAWIQGSDPSTLDVTFEDGGSVHTEWPDVIARGSTTAVTGSLTLPPSGPHAGETLQAAAGMMKALEDGATFELTELSTQVQCFAPPCPADSIDGTLAGCINWARQ